MERRGEEWCGDSSALETNSQGRDPSTHIKAREVSQVPVRRDHFDEEEYREVELQFWIGVERWHEEIDEVKRLCRGVKDGKCSRLDNLPGKDGTARMKAGTKKKALQENEIVYCKDFTDKNTLQQRSTKTRRKRPVGETLHNWRCTANGRRCARL